MITSFNPFTDITRTLAGTRTLAFTLALLAAIGAPAQAQVSTPSPLTLTEAIEHATSRGTRIREAAAALEVSRAAAGPLASAYLPRATASAYDLYSQYPVTVTPIREQGVFPPLDDNTYELSVSASWTVFDFGRGRAARKAAQAVARSAGVRYDLSHMETIEAVTGHYVHLAQLRELQGAWQQRAEALREQEVQLKALFEEGRVSRIDLLKIADAILRAETDLRATEYDIDAVLLALSAELGAPRVYRLEDLALFELPGEDVSVLVPMATTAFAPSVAAAEAQLDAAQFRAREAQRSLFPSFELFATERLRSGSDLAFDDELFGGIRLSVPLFQPGAHMQRQVQQARVQQQQAALEDARNQVEVALGDLNNREQEARARAAATETRVRHLEETYRIEAAAYNEGRLTLTDLLTTEAQLAAGHSEREAARAAITLTRLRRSVLSGVLTPELAVHLTQIQS